MRTHFPILLLLSVLCPIDSAAETLAAKCPPDQHWVRAYHKKAYVRADGKMVKATDVAAHCRKNPRGYTFWAPKLKDGLPTSWQRKKEIGSKWTEEERERVVDAISELPEKLWSVPDDEIFRAKRSEDYPNPASTGPGGIVLYDTAFDQKRNLARVMAHELAHEVYRSMKRAEIREYWAATNWYNVAQDENNPIYISRSSGYVAKDGRSRPDEDFANNIEYFLFNPERLREVTPNAYRWIEGHFGDSFKLGSGAANAR